MRALEENPGENFCSLPTVMSVEQSFKFHTPTDREAELFVENVYKPFLDSVIDNLEKRFQNIRELEVFSIFNTQLWPEDSSELASIEQK